ncbi:MULTISPECIES: DUF1189 domain-containing protein [Bacillus]|uniref:DUF1189 domain-containing protein n=1 Tax=Bacillus TaxID=1386 RepID=UPI000BB7AFEA|nr:MULTISPECIES: DUF1189 domain-containing protein [Bacillus]
MNIFKQFIKSLYSPKDMATFRFQGIGKSILYVFFLVLLTSIPAFVFVGTGTYQIFNATKTVVDADVPNFIIEDGEFTAETDEPVFIEQDDVTIIIDPNNELTLSEINNYGDVIAIQQYELVFVMGGQEDFFNFADLQGFTLTRDDIVSFMDGLGSLMPIILTLILIVMYVAFSAVKFIQVTILGLVGLIIKNSLDRTNLKYRHTWILAAYAVTIPTILFTLTDLLGLYIPATGIISFAASIFVLYLIIKEVKVKKTVEQ